MNNSWNISGLILEGISGTGKSTVLKALVNSERFVKKTYPSSIILSEHQTQRVLEQKDRETGLTVSDNILLLDQHVSYLEQLNDRLEKMLWCRNNQTNMRIPYILERFHFTHVYHYNHITWKDVKSIDLRLSDINCKSCIFTLNREILEKRIFTGRDAAWNNYIQRYGDTPKQILEYFINQQDELLTLSDKSKLDSKIIDASDLSIDDMLNQVLDFWGAV